MTLRIILKFKAKAPLDLLPIFKQASKYLEIMSPEEHAAYNLRDNDDKIIGQVELVKED